MLSQQEKNDMTIKVNKAIQVNLPESANEQIEILQAQMRLSGAKKTKNEICVMMIELGLKEYNKLNN